MKASTSFVEGLIDVLQKQQAVSADRAAALKKLFEDRSKVAFDTFLLQEGLVDRATLLNALSAYYKVPAFDVVGYFFERHYLRMFPKHFLLRHKIIPIPRDENILVVIASQPDNPELLSAIGEHVSYDIRFNVGLEEDIADAIEEYYEKALTEVPENMDTQREREQTEAAGKLLEGDEE